MARRRVPRTLTARTDREQRSTFIGTGDGRVANAYPIELTGAWLAATPAPLTPPVGWVAMADCPLTLYGGFMVELTGRFYRYGVTNANTLPSDSRLGVYDPATNTWTSVETGYIFRLPHGAVIGDTIWFSGQLAYIDGVEQPTVGPAPDWPWGVVPYDPATNTFGAFIADDPADPGYPFDGGFPNCCAVGNRLYFYNTRDWAPSNGPRLRVYDTIADTWSDSAMTPRGTPQGLIDYRQLVAGGGLVYGTEGFNSGTTPNQYGESGDESGVIEIYDPGTDSWTYTSPDPVPRDSMGAAYGTGQVYVVGGLSGRDTLAAVSAYDTTGGTWSQLLDMPSPRSDSVALVSGGALWVSGGLADTGSGQPDPSAQLIKLAL